MAPSKVFFGINLIREKMKLPKLEYPKRKLAVSPEQLMAIETLYEPYLPLPPLGIHKIIAKQLRMDEWRVHVAIGLIRKNRNLARWNEDRDDLPKEMRESQQRAKEEREKAKALEAAEKEAVTAGVSTADNAEPDDAVEAVKEAAPKKRATAKKAAAGSEDAAEAPAPVKATRAKKVVAEDAAAADESAEPGEEPVAVAEAKPKARASRAKE